MVTYRALQMEELCRPLWADFIRRQEVTRCWRRVDGRWTIQDAPFTDDWDEGDYRELISLLRHTLQTGGLVLGAFCGGSLKGWVSVEAGLFGGEHRYLDLSTLYVSAELRGQGIGSGLFARAKEWAKAHGARKLYLSAHSAVESQAFYRGRGCVDAQWLHAGHVAAEPFDCQLECML